MYIKNGFRVYTVKSMDNYHDNDWETSPDGFNGVLYWNVYVPADVLEETVKAAFEMAALYAYCYDDDFEEYTDREGIKEYDKYFPQMKEEYSGCNGMNKFNGYLYMAYGWNAVVSVQEEDFSYVW